MEVEHTSQGWGNVNDAAGNLVGCLRKGLTLAGKQHSFSPRLSNDSEAFYGWICSGLRRRCLAALQSPVGK